MDLDGVQIHIAVPGKFRAGAFGFLLMRIAGGDVDPGKRMGRFSGQNLRIHPGRNQRGQGKFAEFAVLAGGRRQDAVFPFRLGNGGQLEDGCNGIFGRFKPVQNQQGTGPVVVFLIQENKGAGVRLCPVGIEQREITFHKGIDRSCRIRAGAGTGSISDFPDRFSGLQLPEIARHAPAVNILTAVVDDHLFAHTPLFLCGILKTHQRMQCGGFRKIIVVWNAVNTVLTQIGNQIAPVIDLERTHIQMLMIPEVIVCSVHGDDGIIRHRGEIPPGTHRQARQGGAVMLGKGQVCSAVFCFQIRIVGQQEEDRICLRRFPAAPFEFHLQFRVLIQCHGGKEQTGIDLGIGRSPVPVCIALNGKTAVRQPQIIPVIRENCRFFWQQIDIECTLVLKRGKEVPTGTVGPVTGPLIMTAALIKVFFNIFQIFHHLKMDVLVRYRVFIINGYGHGQLVAADLSFIAVTGCGRLAERRPAGFHFRGEIKHPFAEHGFLFLSEQGVAPVINQRGRINTFPHLAADILSVPEGNKLHVFANQCHGFLTDSGIALHQIIKGFMGGGTDHPAVKLQFFIRIDFEVIGGKGGFLHQFPGWFIFLFFQILFHPGKEFRIDHDPGMFGRGRKFRNIILCFCRDFFRFDRLEDQVTDFRHFFVISDGQSTRLTGLKDDPVQFHIFLNLICLQQAAVHGQLPIPLHGGKMLYAHRYFGFCTGNDPERSGLYGGNGVGILCRVQFQLELGEFLRRGGKQQA